jgi:hypothetical protein
MNSKLLLVKSITLLYRESQLTTKNDRSVGLVREVTRKIKAPEINLGLDPEAETIEGLKQTVLAMCEDGDETEYEITELLQRVKVAAGEDATLYDAIKDGLTANLEEQGIKKACISLRRAIQKHFRDEAVKEIIGKASVKLKFNPDDIPDMKDFVQELCTQLEPFQGDVTGANDPAIISEVDFDNDDSIAEIFSVIRKDEDGTGIMRTGWQALNRMIRGGFRRGECAVVSALQHNFKTGMMISLFRQFALYNKPEMLDPTKKPMLLFFSFENEISTNTHLLYKYMKENETGVEVTPQEIEQMSDAEMAAYTRERMAVNGYHSRMIRINPSLWTYNDVFNKIIEIESEGYEIHVLILDYLAMLPTTGCRTGTIGEDIRDLFRRCRNFCSARKICMITPHQISTDAKQLVRDGVNEFVKQIANKGYYDGCRRLDQEVDLEIYMHIEIVNDLSFLTLQRGKHRTVVGQTPREHLYTVLPFEKVAAIPDDVDKHDRSRRKPGAGPRGAANEQPVWMTDMEMAA